MYLDDLVTDRTTVQETEVEKAVATEIFEDAAFKIHKWHLNKSELEGAEGKQLDVNGEETYAKQQLGGNKANQLDSLEQRKGHTQC